MSAVLVLRSPSSTSSICPLSARRHHQVLCPATLPPLSSPPLVQHPFSLFCCCSSSAAAAPFITFLHFAQLLRVVVVVVGAASALSVVVSPSPSPLTRKNSKATSSTLNLVVVLRDGDHSGELRRNKWTFLSCLLLAFRQPSPPARLQLISIVFLRL